jgi:hypothetical protein
MFEQRRSVLQTKESGRNSKKGWPHEFPEKGPNNQAREHQHGIKKIEMLCRPHNPGAIDAL